MSPCQRTLDLCQAFIDAKWDCNGGLNFGDIDVLEKMKGQDVYLSTMA